jgi:hypothetical protein
MRLALALLASVSATATYAQMTATAVAPAALAYPNTDRQDLVEEQFGIKVLTIGVRIG